MKVKEDAMLKIKAGVTLTCLIIALVMSSCGSTPLRTRATQVRLLSLPQVQQVEATCDFIGNVRGSSEFSYWCCLSWGFLDATAYPYALNELLDNAAEIGATHVFVNLGDGPHLMGQAYFCAFCVGPDGEPIVAGCWDADSKPDQAYCEDPEGNRVVDVAYCERAEASNPAKCEERDGIWRPKLDKKRCLEQKYHWIPRARDRESCEAKNGIWLPAPRDEASCRIMGGRWIPDSDVLRTLPEK